MNNPPHVRWMIRRDLPQVLLMDAPSVEPWPEEEFLRTLRQRNTIGMVADKGHDEVAGFMLYELHKTSLELVKFGFETDMAADAMLTKLKSKLSPARRVKVVIDLNEHDDDSIRALARNGFKATGLIRCGADDGSDAIHFEYRVAADPVEEQPVYCDYESDCGYED